MKFFSLSLLILLSAKAVGQLHYDVYSYTPDSVKIGNEKKDYWPKGPKGYSLLLPETLSNFKGTIVSLEEYPVYGADTLKYAEFNKEANKMGFAVLYIASGVPYDLFFSEASCKQVDTTMMSVFKKYNIPNKKIRLLGIMNAGHRALKYFEYIKKDKSDFNPDIKSLVLCESAIDWVRQWYEAQKQVRDHLSEVGYLEGKAVTYLLNTNLLDTPVTDIEKYLNFSTYSYFDTKQRHTGLLKDLPIRAYTFADTDYWFSAKGKGVFDSNYPDMSGIINEQKLAGNKLAELIVFTNKDKHNSGKNLQSDTWGLINKSELLDWLSK